LIMAIVSLIVSSVNLGLVAWIGKRLIGQLDRNSAKLSKLSERVARLEGHVINGRY